MEDQHKSLRMLPIKHFSLTTKIAYMNAKWTAVTIHRRSLWLWERSFNSWMSISFTIVEDWNVILDHLCKFSVICPYDWTIVHWWKAAFIVHTCKICEHWYIMYVSNSVTIRLDKDSVQIRWLPPTSSTPNFRITFQIVSYRSPSTKSYIRRGVSSQGSKSSIEHCKKSITEKFNRWNVP